ncbi:unnamed protein product [Cyprideis torosa]|uniref:Uncharacterized protein n=1 Tax=Cyprideis torosa TaxID=163714 RepID=A0A7R8ZWF8_9CRUS|nr:unnamed protein product [Cyprideis torosa]CAG0904846.1 unnamed protein product [Cyprideis torosa]
MDTALKQSPGELRTAPCIHRRTRNVVTHQLQVSCTSGALEPQRFVRFEGDAGCSESFEKNQRRRGGREERASEKGVTGPSLAPGPLPGYGPDEHRTQTIPRRTANCPVHPPSNWKRCYSSAASFLYFRSSGAPKIRPF